MTIEQNFQFLIEKIEAATAVQDDGGYALDGEIAKLIGWTYRYRDVTHKWGWCRPGTTTHFDAMPPAFTTKIDAAMTLVPNDCGFVMHGPIGKPPCVALQFGNEDHPAPKSVDGWGDYSKGATPALALCSAALRARSAAHNSALTPKSA